MADRYWVGGTGNWSDDTNHWATSSGGSPGGGNLPTAADNVIFDTLSHTGAYTVTLDATGGTKLCNDITFGAPLTGDVTWAGSTALTISGSMTLYSGLVRTYSGSITFNATTTGKTLTFNGASLESSCNFNGSGGGWTIQDTWNNNNAAISLTAGSLNTNNQTVTCQNFSSSNANTRTLTLGSSTINSPGGWNTLTTTNLTFDAGTSTIVLAINTSPLLGSNLTFYNWQHTLNSGGNITYNASNCSFNNLTFTGSSSGGGVLFNGNYTITGTLSLQGNSSANRLLIGSNGTARTLTAAAVDIDNVNFYYITGAGAASPFTGVSLGEYAGCSGITFDSGVTRYWVGDAGNFNDTSHWSTSSGGASGASVPLLPQDIAIFDANSISMASQTITVNVKNIPELNFTDVTNNPTVSHSSDPFLGGDYLAKSGVTLSGSLAMTSYGAGTVNINSGGNTLTSLGIRGSNIVLQSDLTLSGALSVFVGSFDANDFDVSCTSVTDALEGLTKTLTMGSGTWTFTGTGAVFTMQNPHATVNAETSTIVINNTSATAKSFPSVFDAVDRTYYNITFSGDNITVNRSNTFNSFNVNNAALVNGLKLTSGTTQTVSAFTTNGSAGNLAILQSTSAGSAATLSKSGGVVSVDYMSIKDSTATGGASWMAGANSTNVSGNTGWVFSAAPAVSTFMGVPVANITSINGVPIANVSTVNGVLAS